MSDPSRLHVVVTHADNSQSRWAPDESVSANVATGISFGSRLPGGFDTCTLNLPRELARTYADESLFDTIQLIGPGGAIAWEGRVQNLPREQGDSFGVMVGCVGWAAHLKDDPSFREIYVDQSLERWGEQSLADKATLVTASITQHGTPELNPQGALSLKVLANWTVTNLPMAAGLYDAAGIPIGAVQYTWSNGSTISTADANWTWAVITGPDNTFQAGGGTTTTGNLRAAAATGQLTTSSTVDKFAYCYMTYAAAVAAQDGRNYELSFTSLGVYGTHGLTKRGTQTTTEAQGFYASDVIKNAVARKAPLLTTNGVQDTSFVISQVAFFDPVSVEDVVLFCNGYHLYEWGVYEDRDVFFRLADASRLTWEARLDQGAKISLEGDDASAVYNGVVVRYTDPYGKQRTAAPTGYTPADTTSSDLLDASTDNPATAHGIKKWGVISVSTPTTDTGAVQIGRMWLAEASLPSRRGTITVSGFINHPSEGPVPLWRVRAGDWVQVSDLPGDVPRRITDVSYDHDSRTATLSVGGNPPKLEAILEILGT